MDRNRHRTEPTVTFNFENDVSASSQARRALSPLLLNDDDSVDAAVTLAASELVANVVKHTHAGGTMRVWNPAPDATIRVEVEDFDPSLPQVMTPAPHEITGRGLQLLGTLAERWGFEPLPTGKIVWAEFNRDSQV